MCSQNPFPSGVYILNPDNSNTIKKNTLSTTQHDKLNEMILHTTTTGNAAPVHLTQDQINQNQTHFLKNYHPQYKENFINIGNYDYKICLCLTTLVLILYLYKKYF